MIKFLAIASVALLLTTGPTVASTVLHEALKSCIENAVTATVSVVDTEGRKDTEAFTLQCDADRAQALMDLALDVASKQGDELNIKKEKRFMAYFGAPHFSYAQCMRYKTTGKTHCAFILKEGGEKVANQFIKGELLLSQLPLNDAFKTKMGSADVQTVADKPKASEEGVGPESTKGWFASISPNEELSSPVYWADTKEAAKEGAVRSCEKISKSCAAKPAWTDQRGDVFALMCCKKPKFGCAIGVGSTAEQARQFVRNTFSDAGYTKCDLRKYVSARTGEDVD